MTTLCRQLGIPRRTFNLWVQSNPDMAIWIKGAHWIKLEKLAGRPGINIVDAYTITSSRWIKAVELARNSNGKMSRRTLAHWCKTRPGFAKRIGRCWYIDMNQLMDGSMGK